MSTSPTKNPNPTAAPTEVPATVTRPGQPLFTSPSTPTPHAVTKAGGGEVELNLETLKLATEGSLANLATELGEIQTKLAILHAQVSRGQQAERQAQHQLAFHQERLRAIAGYTKAQALWTTLGQEAATYRTQIAELTERQKLITTRLTQLASETLSDLEPSLGTGGGPGPTSPLSPPMPSPTPGKVSAEGAGGGGGNDDASSLFASTSHDEETAALSYQAPHPSPAAVEAWSVPVAEPAVAAPPLPLAPEPTVVAPTLEPAPEVGPELAPTPPPAPVYYSANHFWGVALSDLEDSQADTAIQTRLSQVSAALIEGNFLEASDLTSRAVKGGGRRNVAVWLATAALTLDLDEAEWCLEHILTLLAKGPRTEKTAELEERIKAVQATQGSAPKPKPVPVPVSSTQQTLVSNEPSITINPQESVSPLAQAQVESGAGGGGGAVTILAASPPLSEVTAAGEELATSFYFDDYKGATASSELAPPQAGSAQLLSETETETEAAPGQLPRPFGVRGNP